MNSHSGGVVVSADVAVAVVSADVAVVVSAVAAAVVVAVVSVVAVVPGPPSHSISSVKHPSTGVRTVQSLKREHELLMGTPAKPVPG